MKLTTLALLSTGILSISPAEAAALIHPTAAKNSVEHNVNVWRGAKPSATIEAADLAADRSCRALKISVALVGFAPRTLRTHGFWSGHAASQMSYRATTSGFYADRIRAGL